MITPKNTIKRTHQQAYPRHPNTFKPLNPQKPAAKPIQSPSSVPAKQPSNNTFPKGINAGFTMPVNKNMLQSSHQTISPYQEGVDRFPKIYDAVKRLKPKAKRILSFGCSSGEECQALGRRFPNAEIVGVDIDHYILLEARRKNKNKNIHFTDCLEATGKYDAATILMTLFRIKDPIPHKQWSDTLRKVDAHINPGGYLFIYTSEYNPMEVLGDDYKAVNEWTREHSKGNGKIYYNGYYKKHNRVWATIKKKVKEIWKTK